MNLEEIKKEAEEIVSKDWCSDPNEEYFIHLGKTILNLVSNLKKARATQSTWTKKCNYQKFRIRKISQFIDKGVDHKQLKRIIERSGTIEHWNDSQK